MNVDELQEKLDGLTRAMMDKGLAKPEAVGFFRYAAEPMVWLNWCDEVDAHKAVHFHHGTLSERLDAAAAHIAALPSADERSRDTALRLIAAAADFCTANGFPADFINPLTDAMKRLSENAITEVKL